MVNPRACYETTLIIKPVSASQKLRIAVVGAGPSGLASATTAASRGHSVTLFEKDSTIGGQFNMAKLVPGKEEFYETLRYFKKQIELTGVDLRLNTSATADSVKEFDAIVICTGVLPRQIQLQNNSTKVRVLSYVDVLRGGQHVGERVAVIGAGGIGFDIADYLTHPHSPGQSNSREGPPAQIDQQEVSAFLQNWGIDTEISDGGLVNQTELTRNRLHVPRKVYLLQRKEGKLGAGLGKTTGWIHRTTLKQRQVEELDGCKYIEVNDDGLVIERKGVKSVLGVDTVVLCAGQEPYRELLEPCRKLGKKVFLVGGAHEAGELDAKRAIDQGTRLAATIESAESGSIFEAPTSLTHKIAKVLKFV